MSQQNNLQIALLSKARGAGGAFLLPPRSLLSIGGNDAFRFLQGQITADLNQLLPGQAIEACLLTPQGRLFALCHLFKRENLFFIETEKLLQEVQERLERYLIADDVEIKVTTTPQAIHCFGTYAQHPKIQQARGIIISRLGFYGKDLEVSDFYSLSENLQTKLLSEKLLNILRIEQWIPKWGFELTTQTLPPEARLEEKCISYEKGCYLGQEIVSRLKSIGHVNRLLYGFSSQEEITAGMEIFSPEEPTHALGVLTSTAELDGLGTWVALGYLRRGRESSSSFMARDIQKKTSAQLFLRKKEF